MKMKEKWEEMDEIEKLYEVEDKMSQKTNVSKDLIECLVYFIF